MAAGERGIVARIIVTRAPDGRELAIARLTAGHLALLLDDEILYVEPDTADSTIEFFHRVLDELNVRHSA